MHHNLVSAGVGSNIIGRVYEYFLQAYAASGTKEDGEFYTPACVVKLIAEMIEPYSGVVYDKTTPRLIQFHTLKNAVNPQDVEAVAKLLL